MYVGTGNGDPKLPSVRGYSWATLSQGAINTEAWFSRLGVGREADNLTLYRLVFKLGSTEPWGSTRH
jgi:hypothetical protein